MSTRSKREHKPTSKFLKYYNDEICSNKTIKRSLTKNDSPSPSVNKKRKLETEDINLKKSSCETPTYDSEHVAFECSSSEVRRSSRQAKPNERLKAFSQLSLNSSKEDEIAFCDDQGAKRHKSNLVEEKNLSISNIKGKVGKGKNVGAISPMIRNENLTTPAINTKHLTIGLSDCVQNYEDGNVSQISKRGEERRKALVGAKDTNKICQKDQVKSVINPSDKFYGKMRVIIRKSKSRAEIIGKVGPITGKVIHKSNPDKKAVKLSPDVKKSKELDTASSTVSEKQNTIRVTRNKSVENKVGVTADKVENIRKMQFPYANKALNKPVVKTATLNLRNKSILNRSIDTNFCNKTATIATKALVVNSSQNDIKETIQKFLLMGHKVANAISETLKTNEEELLSKSSTFEKKCINLVQTVANASSDINEEEMEAILVCLDEEQEERRSYRQTFIESLRVAHLTNMALYSQMIRVLRTL